MLIIAKIPICKGNHFFSMNCMKPPVPEIFFVTLAGHVEKTATFAAGFGFLSSRKGMKRESGENPEQSRCCKPHSGMAENHCQVPKPDGKVAKTRGKSEDLPIRFLKAFEEKAEKRGCFPLFAFHFFFGASECGYN